MKIKQYIKANEAQATVELCVMFPIILIIAVIMVNALTFFTKCASFDRSLQQIVSSLGTSIAYGENIQNFRSQIIAMLNDEFDNDFIEFEISVENQSGNHQTFDGILKMYPTLFGMGLRDNIFGVPLPSLNHHQKISIDVYKPGVIF